MKHEVSITSDSRGIQHDAGKHLISSISSNCGTLRVYTISQINVYMWVKRFEKCFVIRMSSSTFGCDPKKPPVNTWTVDNAACCGLHHLVNHDDLQTHILWPCHTCSWHTGTPFRSNKHRQHMNTTTAVHVLMSQLISIHNLSYPSHSSTTVTMS